MKNENLDRAISMIRARRNFWDRELCAASGNYKSQASAAGIAYDAALTILEAALTDDTATLNELDYYYEY